MVRILAEIASDQVSDSLGFLLREVVPLANSKEEIIEIA